MFTISTGITITSAAEIAGHIIVDNLRISSFDNNIFVRRGNKLKLWRTSNLRNQL